MTGEADLHIHSAFSDDGDCTVPEIFALAGKEGLSAIAITDHDTMAAHDDAVRESKLYPSIRYIPGIELTTMYPENSSQQHILGYFADPDNSDLKQACGKIFKDRVSLATERMKALERCGMAADEEALFRQTKGLAPTATAVILAILNNPENSKNPLLQSYISGESKNDRVILFYREFLAQGRPAYVPFRSIPTHEAIEAVIRAGGVPVLAHPGFTKSGAFLDNIRSMGIAGIEAHSSYHSAEETAGYCSYAEKHGLIATAGSDFHGPTTKPHVKLGQIRGNSSIIDEIEQWKEKRR